MYSQVNSYHTRLESYFAEKDIHAQMDTGEDNSVELLGKPSGREWSLTETMTWRQSEDLPEIVAAPPVEQRKHDRGRRDLEHVARVAVR